MGWESKKVASTGRHDSAHAHEQPTGTPYVYRMGDGLRALLMKLRRAQSPYAVPVGWTLYTFTMVVICLALTFPYDSLHAMFLLRLSEKTGLDIHTEQWGFQPPAGVV